MNAVTLRLTPLYPEGIKVPPSQVIPDQGGVPRRGSRPPPFLYLTATFRRVTLLGNGASAGAEHRATCEPSHPTERTSALILLTR